jgi:hypothetical protein
MSLFVTEDTPSLKPIREYLVAITGLYEETITHGTLLLHAPSPIYNETAGLCEDGVVTKAPMDGGFDEDIVGKKARFWFMDAHAAYKNNYPKVNGHLLVAPYSIISVEGKMVGEHILCKPIEMGKTASGLIIPNIELISMDSLQKPKENWREWYTDRGVVCAENDHFPIGTILFWGEDSNVRHGWEGGFLVKRRMVLCWGKEAERMSYVKKKRK